MSKEFRVSRIRKKRISQSKTFAIAKSLPWGKMLGFALAIFIITYGFFWAVSKINIGRILSFFAGVVAEDLRMDSSGRTNILVLGTGGEGHQGKDLTDSIIVASYLPSENAVTMVSVPRDLYLRTERFGGTRINGLLEFAKEAIPDEKQALEYVRGEMERIFGLPLHYYVKIDFQALKDVVDELGGVDIYVEEKIDDPFYPDDKSYGYKPFYLDAGMQHLDGETALKYARSRETSSDFDRSLRQQRLLRAMKEKAKQEGILESPSKISRLYDTVSDHVATNFEIRELISLAKVAKNLDEQRIFSYGIHDDPTKTGGFVYTPLRELFGGAFVLIPASNDWVHIKRYLGLVTAHGLALSEKAPLQVLNGTKRSGAAAETKMILKRYGFNVIRFGNGRAQDVAETTYYYKTPEPPPVIRALQFIVPGKISKEIPPKYLEEPYQSEASVIIELGADYLPVFDALDIFRNIVPLNPPTPQGTETTPESSPESSESQSTPPPEESAETSESSMAQ